MEAAERMKVRDLLNVAMQAGEILLKSGAEVYRVEDTVVRICRAYGVECECIALLSGIFISAEGENKEPVSLTKRIRGHSIDLTRINLVNCFSRGLEKELPSYGEAKEILDGIQGSPQYSVRTRLVVASFTAFVYTMLFRGSVKEAVAAFFCGLMIYAVKELVSRSGFFQFFEYFVSGLVAGAMSLASVLLFPELSVYKIIVGAIIFLVPGVSITNGIKDALYGDIVSSLFRLTEAVFIAVAVGSGVGIVLSVGIKHV